MCEEDDRDPWWAEAEAMEFCEGDFAVADCAELPVGLEDAVSLAEDFDWTDDYEEWLGVLLEDNCLALALEQSCHEGIALPWDMRGSRLGTAPEEVLFKLHMFWDECSPAAAVRLQVFVYWLVRCERARRRGNAYWSPKLPMPPREEQRAFYRPQTLLFRRQI